MTYNELATFIEKMSDEDRKKDVAIFVFPNGEMEMLNNAAFMGDNPEIESHCSDFEEGYVAVGFPYLVCGLSE